MGDSDRVVIDHDVMVFQDPANKTTNASPFGPEVDDAFIEAALKEYKASTMSAEEKALQEKMRQFEEMKAKWEAGGGPQNEADKKEQDEERRKMAMELVNKEILDLLPKAKEAKKVVDQLCRENLTFE